MAKTPAPEAAPAPPRDPRAPASPDPRYWAFLSYSHRDRAEADKLHKALERYRLPADLVGTRTRTGIVPPRLHPVFRDREELTASANLGKDVKEALAASRALVVLCSPAAAISRWANAEIGLFRLLHPDAPVLAAIIAGEPWASDVEGREAEECFPLALRRRWDAKGRMTGQRAEPIAADLRPDGDGKTLGTLKIVAGLLGLPLDRLARREERRTRRRLAWAAAAGVAGTTVTGGLALAAVDARNDASDQREAAEGLVTFMLGDLRSKLEPVGRLDVLDGVGTRTLAYFEAQDRGKLSANALGQRARALHLLGEVAYQRGELPVALRRFREAERSTSDALARRPEDPQRIFDHAQSIFWVGLIAKERSQPAVAEARFRDYRRLAQRLVALDPRDAKWRLEGLYADMALGALLQEGRAYRRALPVFAAGERNAQALLATDPGNRNHRILHLELLGWRADAERGTGRLANAIATRERQLAHAARIAAGQDQALDRVRLIGNYSLAGLHLARGDVALALSRAQGAHALATGLLAREPSSDDHRLNLSRVLQILSRLHAVTGDMDAAAAANEQACAIAEGAGAAAEDLAEWRVEALLPCLRQRARLVALQGGLASALPMAERAVAAVRATPGNPAMLGQELMSAQSLLGDILFASGDAPGARAQWTQALAAPPPGAEEPPSQQALRSHLLHRLGRGRDAQAVDARLAAMGYKEPRYLAELRGGTGII